jgi:CRP/FNR family transcriptional regulator, cyclic AMP receptor protein
MNALEGLALVRLHAVMQHGDRASVDDWTEVLAAFPLFSGLSKRRLRKLVRSASFAEVARGETVISNGERSDSLHVILGGAARARSGGATRELGVGDYFGELALVDGALRSSNVVATQGLHVIRLPAHAVLRLARQHPALTLTMLRNLSRQIGRPEAQAAR